MSNKIEHAWAVLKKLTAREQEIAADAILDYAASRGEPELSDEQAREVERRLADPHPRTVTITELRARVGKLGA